MRSTFKILFYVRKNYVNKSGKVGIMVRITLNGEISQFSSKLDIDPKSWNTKSGKILLDFVNAPTPYKASQSLIKHIGSDIGIQKPQKC